MSVMKHQGQGCGGHCCLKIEHLGVQIDGEDILRDVNLHIHCGEIAALIGPNGAGKSTLIRSILGQREHQGKITFQPAGGRSRKFRIGYVPQSPSFSAGEPVSVLALFAMCIGKGPAAFHVGRRLRETVMECLRNVHGESLVDKKIGSLSGGELQRVLLALALEPIPQILILDEPLSGVDVGGEHLLLDMLDEIRQKYDLSILFSTHDFSTLRHYADKVILLQQAILKVGTPGEVLHSPEFQAVFHLNLGEEGGCAQ